jgi:DNA-directed RNA polymerase alpha subunit
LAEDPLDVAISDLELPTQISNRLFALRIIDLGDLVKWSEKQLLNGRGLGEATIKKLKAKLLFYGLALTQDPSL